MTEYNFVTLWRIEASIDRVFSAIYHSLEWPNWWRGLERVTELERGTGNGVGSVHRYTWRSRLLYRLTFDIRVTRVDPLVALEGVAQGELEGIGRWHFIDEGTCTAVRYEWRVRTTKGWMNLIAPLSKPVFAWSHHALMAQGGRGLANLLNARLILSRHQPLST